MAQGDEKTHIILEKKFPIRIYGSKRNEELTYEIRSNQKLQELFVEPNSGNTK
jgi:hypothetical protein